MVSIFIELIDDNGNVVYVNVDHIISIEELKMVKMNKIYSRIYFSNGGTYTIEKSPKHLLELIRQKKLDERKDNTICLV